MDAILKNNFKNILAGYELVEDYTVSGSAITSYDFTGLNITKEDDYMLVSDVVNAYGGYNEFYLFANSNYTQSNYYSQTLRADNIAVPASRTNAAYLCYTPANGQRNLSISNIKLTNNLYFVAQSSTNMIYGTTLQFYNSYETSTFTATSLTSLRVSGAYASSIAIGSRFQLYKRVAPIIADITVSTTTTSVDITGLSIDKGSEYMLVSDVVNSSGSGSNYYLYHNSNETLTNYYEQTLIAYGSSIFATRNNNSTIIYGYNNNRALFYTNIKLTNNGYLVWQSNGNTPYASGSIELHHFYGTSTQTQTSINSLKIVASVSNSIASGSRFQLIKLK